jgi:hypothetical protein
VASKWQVKGSRTLPQTFTRASIATVDCRIRYIPEKASERRVHAHRSSMSTAISLQTSHRLSAPWSRSQTFWNETVNHEHASILSRSDPPDMSHCCFISFTYPKNESNDVASPSNYAGSAIVAGLMSTITITLLV